MRNVDIPSVFVARSVDSARNGRGNFRFKGDCLYSYDNLVAKFEGDTLLINCDVFSATSSRHQSAIKRVAAANEIPTVHLPDLTELDKLAEFRDPGAINKFLIRRKLAISEIERKIESSKAESMREHHRAAIMREKDSAKRAAKLLPFDQMIQRISDFV